MKNKSKNNKKPKNKREVSIEFVGNNANEVQGSATLIEYEKFRLLLDCGMIQSKDKLKQYRINKSAFSKFGASTIDAVIISHIHLDHSVGVAILQNQGFKGKVYIPKGNKKLYELMLRDALKISDADCKFLSTKYNKEYSPLFTEIDIEALLENTHEIDFNEYTKINEHFNLIYTPSYHILNSAQIELFVRDKNYRKKISYLCDLGNDLIKKPFVTDIQKIKASDIVIAETTYAMKPTKTQDMYDKEFEIVKQGIINATGTVLFASFALHRAEEIIYMLWNMREYIDCPIYLDSPLSVDIFMVYLESVLNIKDKKILQEILDWTQLHLVKDWQESNSLRNTSTKKIVITTSGFLVAGRIRDYLQTYLPVKGGHVFFCGYGGGEGSLSHKIMNSNSVSIDPSKADVNIKMNKTHLMSLTSHIQHESMVDYYSSIKCNEIYLVHGSKTAQYQFAEVLLDEYDKKLAGTKVFVPNVGDKVVIKR